MWLASKIDDLDSLVKITHGTSLHKTKKQQQEQDQLIYCLSDTPMATSRGLRIAIIRVPSPVSLKTVEPVTKKGYIS